MLKKCCVKTVQILGIASGYLGKKYTLPTGCYKLDVFALNFYPVSTRPMHSMYTKNLTQKLLDFSDTRGWFSTFYTDNNYINN